MRILHIIQAEILIAQYLYCREDLKEGRCHNNAAVTLAVNYGLNRLYPNFGYGDQSPQSPTLLSHSLPAPQSWVEFGERLNLFWSVFNIDRCWLVVGSHCIMPDDAIRGGHCIDSPWPLDMTDYERVSYPLPFYSYHADGIEGRSKWREALLHTSRKDCAKIPPR